MLETGLIFLQDAPTEVTSRVQIAKTGKFKDPRYGNFSITALDFKSWMDNFRKLSSPDAGRKGLPIDVDHSPEKGQGTEAAGWVKSIDTMGEDGKTSTPNELWASVEWNSLGVELIKDERYAYLSPSYQFDYKDETGTGHGTALVGVGLTNRPFLSMATVSLSSHDAFATLEEPLPGEPEGPDQSGAATRPRKAADSQRVMPDYTNIAKALNLAEDADEATVLAAVAELGKTPEAHTTSLDEQAKAEGKVVLDAGAVAALAADAKAGRDAKDELHLAKFTAGYTHALDEGRVTAAQKDSLKTFYDAQPDACLSFMADAPVVVNTEAKGSGSGSTVKGAELSDEFAGMPVDDEAKELHEATMAISLARSIPYEAALELALAGVTS